MATVPAQVHGRGDIASERAFFGHPRGLSTLFFSEMWERFSYYGMRGFLILYITASTAVGGLGMDVPTGAAIVGTYAALAYAMNVPGGWLADRVLGQRRAVLYGGILIAAGHYTLAVPLLGTFYLGLLLIILGTGLLKPNISVIVGQLYAPQDPRRDSGFSIFYMGINLGAFIAPILTGYLVQSEGFRARLAGWGLNPNSAWHWGFAAAGVGMTFGLIQYVAGGRYLGTAGIEPGGARTPELRRKYRRQAMIWLGGSLGVLALVGAAAAAGSITILPTTVRDAVGYSLLAITIVFFGSLFLDRSFTPEERDRLKVIVVYFLAAAVFWSVFEQAATTLNLFANDQTRNGIAGHDFPSSWFQSLNSLFIIAFAPVFAWLWIALGKRQPPSPFKFSLGLIGVGVSFLILVPAARLGATGVLVSPLWLAVVYLVQTFAELCLSPVGLSSMTKLAPARVVGSMMGVWFLGASIGNFMAGLMAGFYASMPLPTLFGRVGLLPIGAGLLMLIFVRRLTRMMHGVT